MPYEPRNELFNDAVGATKGAFTERLNRTVNASNRVVREFNERRRPEIPTPGWPNVLVTTDSAAAGGGKYNGVIDAAQLQPTADEDFTWTFFGPSGGTPCLIVDAGEPGSTRHRIPDHSNLMGVMIGVERDTDRPIVVVNYGRDAVQRVDLAQVGGTDGSDSTPPSYTYSATKRDGLAATNPQVVMQRPNGEFQPATHGLGHDTDAGFIIVWCDEIPRIDTCASTTVAEFNAY